MKVKVKDKIYDGEKEPVMVILNEKDKENIKDMHPGCDRYCMFPDSYSEKDLDNFMKVEKLFCDNIQRKDVQ